MGAEGATALRWRGWDDGTALRRLRDALPDTVLGEQSFRDETTVVVRADAVLDVLEFLRSDPECAFDFLTDVTAVHWPARAEEPFDVVYHLYSFERNVRLRVVCPLAGDTIASATPVWAGAGWLERECYDMFGIRFEGHPDLRRILMPEDYDGWPLRKENPLKS